MIAQMIAINLMAFLISSDFNIKIDISISFDIYAYPMKLTYKTLAGEFTIEVSKNTEAEVKQAIANQFNVHPYRVSLFPWENIDYGVVIQPSQWKLLDWTPLERLSWDYLSTNPRAIQILQQYPERINWQMLCINPEAIPMLLENRDKIVWHQFAANPSPDAIPLLEEFLEKGGGEEEQFTSGGYYYLFWARLSENPHALPLLEKHMKHVKWYGLLSINPSPDLVPFLQKHMGDHEIVEQLSHNPYAIDLIEKHMDSVNWSELSKNPKAIHLLENNIDRIDWWNILQNPNAIPILEKHTDKITAWYKISENPNAVPLLLQYPDKINWSFLCGNRSAAAMELLEMNLNKIDNDLNLESARDSLLLSRNPYAIPLLSRHPQFIQWHVLANHPEIFEWIE